MKLFKSRRKGNIDGLEFAGILLDYNFDYERTPEYGEDIKYEFKCFEYACFLYSQFDIEFFSKITQVERDFIYKDVALCSMTYTKLGNHSVDETIDIIASRLMSYFNLMQDGDTDALIFFMTNLLCDIDSNEQLSNRVYPEDANTTSPIHLDLLTQAERREQVIYFLHYRYPEFMKVIRAYMKKLGIK